MLRKKCQNIYKDIMFIKLLKDDPTILGYTTPLPIPNSILEDSNKNFIMGLPITQHMFDFILVVID